MRCQYTEHLNCSHSVQVVHYSHPNDILYAICPNCEKYAVISFNKTNHRIAKWMNGMMAFTGMTGTLIGVVIGWLISTFHP